MRVTDEASRDFDPAGVVDPHQRGGVAWSQFNESFEAFQQRPWWKVNEGRSYGIAYRLLRLAVAFTAQRRDAIVDLAGKTAALWRCPVPRNPDVVFFGAEAGWEACILQALYGDGGRVVLIDSDPLAYERYLQAPEEVTIPAPRGFPERQLVIRRDRSRIEYLQQDLFDVDLARSFDVGIDWGLIEHFDDAGKQSLMARCREFVRDGGLEVSSTPRDALTVRLFYYAFRDEVNFGYRELMSLKELCSLLESGGYSIEDAFTLTAHNVVAARVRHQD